MPEKRKIFVVDDHPMLRDGLAEMINRTDDLMICGEAESAEEALEKIPPAQPDLVIVDLSLPGLSGMDLVRQLKTGHPELKVLVLSMHEETVYAERVVRAGARGYIMKRQVAREINSAIRAVLNGDLYLSPALSKGILETALRADGRRADAPEDLLSERELEVFKRIGKGEGRSDIARSLGLNVKTIETYLARMREKLHARDSSQLYQQAVRWIHSGSL